MSNGYESYEKFVISILSNDAVIFKYNNIEYTITHILPCIRVYESKVCIYCNRKTLYKKYESVFQMLHQFNIDGNKIREVWDDIVVEKSYSTVKNRTKNYYKNISNRLKLIKSCETYEDFMIKVLSSDEFDFAYKGVTYSILHNPPYVYVCCDVTFLDGQYCSKTYKHYYSNLELLEQFTINGKKLRELWNDIIIEE